MQMGFSVKLYGVAIKLAALDPALAVSVKIKTADSTEISVVIPAEESRTVGTLADQVIATLPEKVVPHRSVGVTDVVNMVSLGLDKPVVTLTQDDTAIEDSSVVVEKDTFDNTMGYAVAAGLGYFLG